MKNLTPVHSGVRMLCVCGVADVDECREELDTCAFRCQNVVGTFRCTCPRGYQLSTDGKHCEGMTITGDRCLPLLNTCPSIPPPTCNMLFIF